MHCCSHQDSEHHLAQSCLDVIHYPSEDYPCLCSRYAPSEGEKCQCGHGRATHVTARVCRPESGEVCECRVTR